MIAAFGVTGTKTAEYCTQHAPNGMVNVKARMCRTEDCSKQPSFGVSGTKTAEFCAKHAPNGMVNVCSRKCRTEGFSKVAVSGVAGTKTSAYCTRHALDGMVNAKRRKCTTEDCRNQPSLGVADTKTAEVCAKHAPCGMVNVKNRKCGTEGIGIISAFGVAGTKPAEHCVQHSRPRCGVEGCRERGIGPNHSGKEAISDASSSDSKHKTVHSPPAQTNPPSGCSQGSRKRVIVLKRAVVLESAAGAVTMPEIEGQKHPVKRCCSVKTEVQVSL